MKEIRLFEVGFKERPDSTGYHEKFYVGAVGALSAAELALKHLVQKADAWWADDGTEFMIFEYYAEDKKADEDMTDEEILATKKYQNKAARAQKEEQERIQNLYLARIHDVGELVI